MGPKLKIRRKKYLPTVSFLNMSIMRQEHNQTSTSAVHLCTLYGNSSMLFFHVTKHARSSLTFLCFVVPVRSSSFSLADFLPCLSQQVFRLYGFQKQQFIQNIVCNWRSNRRCNQETLKARCCVNGLWPSQCSSWYIIPRAIASIFVFSSTIF